MRESHHATARGDEQTKAHDGARVEPQHPPGGRKARGKSVQHKSAGRDKSAGESSAGKVVSAQQKKH